MAPQPAEMAPSPCRGRWFTYANALTLVRLALVPALVMALSAGASTLGFLIFALAVVTDLLDGRVARRRGEVSALGGFLDHSTDALFVSAGLATLACSGNVPAVLPALILLALTQYALDSRVLAGRQLKTSWLGRWNGVAYYVLLGIPLARDGLGLPWPSAALVVLLGWGLVLSTLISMIDRAVAYLSGRRARDWPAARRAGRSQR